MRHELKIWPEFFEAVVTHRKTHELRRNDRFFAVGDRLRLREWEPVTSVYSGREVEAEVTYMTSPERPCALSSAGLAAGFAILSIQLRATSGKPGNEGEK